MARTRSPLKFKQADVTRAVKAALASGLRVLRTEVEPDGKIVLVHVGEEAPTATSELEAWRAKRRARAA
jgi:hypothetical protein